MCSSKLLHTKYEYLLNPAYFLTKYFVSSLKFETNTMWFSVACFGVRASVMFHLIFVHYTFSSMLVAVWPHFGK